MNIATNYNIEDSVFYSKFDNRRFAPLQTKIESIKIRVYDEKHIDVFYGIKGKTVLVQQDDLFPREDECREQCDRLNQKMFPQRGIDDRKADS